MNVNECAAKPPVQAAGILPPEGDIAMNADDAEAIADGASPSGKKMGHAAAIVMADHEPRRFKCATLRAACTNVLKTSSAIDAAMPAMLPATRRFHSGHSRQLWTKTKLVSRQRRLRRHAALQ